MTEREYVETIRKAASDYIEQLRNPTSVKAIEHWAHIKNGLSSHTVIALCDAWLAAEKTDE